MAQLNSREKALWLNLTHEDPIEPNLPICDPHHHLWDGPGDRGHYLVEDFLRDAGNGHHIVRTVFVECGTHYRAHGPREMRPVGETEFAHSVGARPAKGQYGSIDVAAGIVAYADLTMGVEVFQLLEMHMAAGGKRLRGIRQSCTWDSSPGIVSMGYTKEMMSDTRFREGFAQLNKYGLSFDAWQYYTQLTDLVDLARAFPDTTIIVNHTGGPLGTGRHAEKGREVFAQWQTGMKRLAACANVVVKLGGLGMPRCGFGWEGQAQPPGSAALAASLSPYITFCIDIFGVQRCMFESNFPMDKESYAYTVLWNGFKRICKHCSADEKKALFHDTAARTYRLVQQ